MKKNSNVKANIILQMYLNENLGDDLFIEIIAKKYPDVNFTIFGIGNRPIPLKYGIKYNNVHVISISKIERIINLASKIIIGKDYILEKQLKKSDGIITLGGSVFIDGKTRYEAFKAKVLTRVRQHALKLKKPTFVIGANFGPVYNKKYIDNYKKYFEECVNVCFRDRKSKETFKNLKNVDFAPDVIFNYNKSIKNTQKNSVGISIIDLLDSNHLNKVLYKDKYESKIVEIINELSTRGYNINLYSFCNNQGDNKAIHRIMDRVESPNNIKCYDYKDLNIEEFVSNYVSNEYLIATRFHGMILGLINNIKVYPIVYDIKTQNVIDDLNIKKYSTLDNIEKINVKEILSVKLNPNIDEICKNAKNQFTPFANYFAIREDDIDEKSN